MVMPLDAWCKCQPMERVDFGVLTTLTDVVRVQEAHRKLNLVVFGCIVQWPLQIGQFNMPMQQPTKPPMPPNRSWALKQSPTVLSERRALMDIGEGTNAQVQLSM